MFVATGNGWKVRQCTTLVSNMQLTTTLVNCVYTTKIHTNLVGRIYHCYLSTYSLQNNPNNVYSLLPKKAVDTCSTAKIVQLPDSKNTVNDLWGHHITAHPLPLSASHHSNALSV